MNTEMKAVALALVLGACVPLTAGEVSPSRTTPQSQASVAQTANHVTLTGLISDSLCKAKHEEAAEGQGKMADHDCTVSCVRGGSKYVLLVDDKVFRIANQTFADLEKHAGHKVKMTGELKGDEMTVGKVEEIG